MPAVSARLALRSLAFGWAALALVVVGSLVASAARERQVSGARQILETRDALSDLQIALTDSETGERGYLLTGQRDYLEPYEAGRRSAERSLDVLRRLLGGGPNDAQVKTLAGLSGAILSKFEAVIALRESDKEADAMALLGTDGAKRSMDDLRAMIRRLSSLADSQLDASRVAADFANRIVLWLDIAAVLATLAVSIFSYRALRRHVVDLANAANDLRRANAKIVSEAQQRDELADQLRQAQKMDAVGQLTGGIAHDFNNMLAIVVSSINLAKRRLARGVTDVGGLLDGALDGADRASKLTRRLMAFGRRQALEENIVDINVLLENMADILRQAATERVTIATDFAADVWPILADANQLENAVVNIVINARDAMPKGGQITLTTRNVAVDARSASMEPGLPTGEYVLLTIGDTGEGMPADVVRQAFDPFFTTKAVGKGSGLGLSQVYGFVRQSNGVVRIDSQPGVGTCVKIYLPRNSREVAADAPRRTSRDTPQGDAREVVLVVDDDEKVRSVTVESLRELGYTVIHASGGTDAASVLEGGSHVDVLVTDVVMPDINGAELAAKAAKIQPDIKVLFTTGFARDALPELRQAGGSKDVLMKPFTLEELARRTREALDRGR